ncbi:Uu.00g014700.m01.CDS01 [Anthostomella pinea]|uniref:Arp2/3 complex 41 kDa subunit n=1 Tax=Anthostomella pinea TaxID=933095 RepID=A0AAI8VYE1_9PEZI|nr:Uu.00g014700.m01.CDS01 [Anthostomella pinea]
MAAPEVHHLFHHPIADHSFSADRKTLAVAKDSALELYGRVGSAFKLKDELKGHDKTITSVDIAANSGRIVTCSQDRNALVWEPSPTGYKPTLVLLRIARAATFVRWSPSETKFAVGSGDRVIAVCYFEEENDWWVSKHLKKPIRSTITTVNWHPNSVLLAAGSTDAHARVFSSFIKGVDARPEPSVWGERLPFNTVCGEFLNNSAGWVHSVAFSPSGNALAFAAHDSSITVVYPTGPEQPPQAVISVNTQLLPFMSMIWNGETEIIAAGYDCEAFRFQGDSSGWQLSGTLEAKGRPGLGDAREESALNMFRQMDLKGKVKDDTQLKTVHQNTISTVRIYEGNGESVSKFSNRRTSESALSSLVSDDQTISIHSGDSEHVPRIHAAVHTIHGICLEATKTYLCTHEANRRLRASSGSGSQHHDAPRTPSDSQPPFTYSYSYNASQSQTPSSQQSHPSDHNKSHRSDRSRDKDTTIPPATNSLLHNVSSICGMIWTGSQRDRLDVLNVERLAVDSMARLLAWAETVALGDYDEWAFAGEVLEAGHHLCAWLGVPDAVQAMETLEADLAGWGRQHDAI